MPCTVNGVKVSVESRDYCFTYQCISNKFEGCGQKFDTYDQLADHFSRPEQSSETQNPHTNITRVVCRAICQTCGVSISRTSPLELQKHLETKGHKKISQQLDKSGRPLGDKTERANSGEDDKKSRQSKRPADFPVKPDEGINNKKTTTAENAPGKQEALIRSRVISLPNTSSAAQKMGLAREGAVIFPLKSRDARNTVDSFSRT